MAPMEGLLALFSVVCLMRGVSTKSLVLGGGSMSMDSVMWPRIIELAGGTSHARIGVISAASSTPESSGEYYVNHFRSLGTHAQWIPIHEGNPSAISDPSVIKQIDGLTGIFFSGGDQARIVKSLLLDNGSMSPALQAVHRVYARGGVVSGTSAGAACMPSAAMITGGMSWEALRYGACEHNTGCPAGHLQYYRNGGIGVLNGFMVDTHFSERGREGRLTRLLSYVRQTEAGFGIDEDTAMVIRAVDTNDSTAEVVGSGGVFMANISRSSVDPGAPYWRITEVLTHYLTEGDTINLSNGEVKIDGWKRNLKGREKYEQPLSSEKIFNGNRDTPNNKPEFVRVSGSLFDSYRDDQTWGRTEKSGPVFRVKFYKSGADGFGGYSPTHGGWRISYTNMDIEMGPD